MSGPLGHIEIGYEQPTAGAAEASVVNTFNFTTYDESNRLGAVLCLNSLPNDVTMWRHGLMVFHPSGDLLLSKAFARCTAETSFGTSNLRYTCEVPFRTWTLRYEGFAQRASPAVLRDSVLCDTAEVPMSFELTYEAIVPAWGHVLDAATGFHYEQNGRMTGWWRYADETYEFDGVAFRDRILGPKDTSKMRGHNWFNGVVENGDAFFLTVSAMTDDPSELHGSACVYVGGQQLEAEIVDMPMWDDIDVNPGRIDVVLRSEAGEHRIALEPLHSSPWMYISSPHVPLQPALFGHNRRATGALLLWESASRVTWDGRAGYGHAEQSLAVS